MSTHKSQSRAQTAVSVEASKASANSASSDLLAEYLRKDELAEEFGVSTRTIERWVRLRLIPAPVRLGRTSLYNREAVKEHLAKQLGPKRQRRRRS